MANLIKIVKDDSYNYKWSVDGNKYGDTYDITSAGGFGDTNLVNAGWEEILAVNGGLFYTWESAHYACGLEKSRGTNNQDVSMSAVSDYNNAMAIACIDDELWFGKQSWIISNKLESAYGAITGIGLVASGKACTYGHTEFASQYNTKSGRTIIGEDKDGNYLSYSIKGETGSSGITGAEATQIALDNGFYNAIMLDGGGSVWRRYLKAYDITTTRKVKNALILYRKKKASDEDDTKEDSSVPMFSERLSSAGMKNNKYWYDANYNKGAKSAGTMLPNCFAGETEFITKNGIKRFDEVVGQDVEVLGRDGTFYKAHVNKYEPQQLYKVCFNDHQKSEYYATANHRWICASPSDNDIIRTTEELSKIKPRTAKMRVIRRYDLEEIVPELQGIFHGFIYGDGTYRKALDKTVMLLCGHKKDFMLPLVMQDTTEHKIHECTNGVVEVCYFDKNYKLLPDIEKCSDGYLLGFLVGYIASDGNVCSAGSIDITSVKEDSMYGLRDICARLGLITSIPRRYVHNTNFKKNAILYRMRIYKGLPTKYFINTKQRHTIESSLFNPRQKNFTHIKSIEKTDRVEEVYCVDEPIHHEFTLANGVLTKNCTCFCLGRSEEIAGQAVKVFPNISVGGFYDAKEWYDKSDWVGSNQPVEGGILCWGASSDKYGHVAICERVLGNTGNGWKVLVSQSNYGGTYFETKEYVVNRGSKTAGVGFIYNGCLHNPYINDIRVERDTTKNQVEVLVDLLKLRKDANGDAVEGLFAAPGIYDIKETKESGDYTWAKLSTERWIALNDAEGWTKTYFVDNNTKTDPELENDIAQLKEQINSLNSKIETLNKETTELKSQNDSLTAQVNTAKQAEVVAENKSKAYKEIIDAAKVILDREV